MVNIHELSLIHVARGIVSYQGVLTFCFVIFALAIGVYWRGFRRKIKNISHEMRQALEILKSMPDADGFPAVFKDFSDSLQKYPTLSTLWREFKENLVFPSVNDSHPTIKNAIEPSFCFNDHSIIANTINLQFYNAFPNYLTGLGILGTFVGLVAGIYIAGNGISSSNATELRESLQGLLHGASQAFWTSICGLLTSIIFSWREKHNMHGLRGLIDEWNENLEKRLVRITPESLGQKQLEVLNRQNTNFEEFATQVAFNIAEAFDQRMSDRLVPVLESVIASMEGLRQDRNQTNEKILVQMVEEFKNILSSSAGKEIAQLGESIRSMNESLSPLLKEMSAAQKEMQGTAQFISDQVRSSYEQGAQKFGEGIDEALDKIRSNINELGSALNARIQETFDQMTEKVKSTLAGFDDGINKLAISTQSAADMTDEMKGFVVAIGDGLKLTSQVQNQIQESLGSMEKISADLKGSADSVLEINSKVHDAVTRIQEISGDFVSIQEQLQLLWRGYAERFEGLDAAFEKVFKEIHNGLDTYAEKTAEYLYNLDEHTGKITESLGGVAQELKDAIEDLSSDGLEANLDGTVQELKVVIENLSRIFHAPDRPNL